MKDTFTLWARARKTNKEITWVSCFGEGRKGALKRKHCDVCVVKLECRIVQPQRKPKRGKYPNDNFGLPAGYTPNNPDNLTREQVGEGFRLLADVEIWERPGLIGYKHIHRLANGEWSTSGWWGQTTMRTYRVPINTPLDINPELKTK